MGDIRPTQARTMDPDKLAKILALTSSDHEGEALAAFRAARKLVEAHGYQIADVINAGLAALRHQSGLDSALTQHAAIFEEILAAAERRKARHNARKDTVRNTRSAAIGVIPAGLFEADIKLPRGGRNPAVKEILTVSARVATDEGHAQLPMLVAKGRIAARILTALSASGCDTITARIKVRRPFQAGDLPAITFFE
ncbi:hypothetical protein GCM10019059_42790 [Camelimonas fluminis]|nr:hypothetical protein GCM10019059_42790 [Camelimonas fluminis]